MKVDKMKVSWMILLVFCVVSSDGQILSNLLNHLKNLHKPDLSVKGCNMRINADNTLLINPNHPQPFNGGIVCSYTIRKEKHKICQLRVDFHLFRLAQPNGDGICSTDYFTVSNGNTTVPRICGDNTGQHVYIDFIDDFPLTVTVATTGSVVFNRRWELLITQIKCLSPNRAPTNCLQYYRNSSGFIRSFNYGMEVNGNLNSLGIQGTRQLASLDYRICIQKSSCGVTFSTPTSDRLSFTLTRDVTSVDPTLIGNSALMEQNCLTDFIEISSPFSVVNGVRTALASSTFCGLGVTSIYTQTGNPLAVRVVTDDNETPDIGNRGFYFNFIQEC